jgi:hypothetical protein
MVMPAFHRFPDEAAIIGRLLAGYAELEIDLLNCVSVARHDFDAVLKAMFRTRGETRRIEVADALGRQLFQAADLGTDFEMAVGAVRYCLRIRNQHSHCNWYDDRSGQLAFVNVEEIAKGNQLVRGFGELTRRYVDVATLESQQQFFSYADALLTYANYQLRFQARELREQVFVKPAQLAQPPLHL